MSVIKRTEMPRFRSNYNYGPDCTSKTVYGPSNVDSSQYEEVSSLVTKLLRGELRSDTIPVYDADSSDNPEKVISEMPVTRTPGFDLADASVALKEGLEAGNALKKAEDDKAAQVKKAEEEAKKKEQEEKEKQGSASIPPHASAGGHEGAK